MVLLSRIVVHKVSCRMKGKLASAALEIIVLIEPFELNEAPNLQEDDYAAMLPLNLVQARLIIGNGNSL